MAVTVDAKCAADTEISAVSGATGKTSTNLTVGASATALFAVLVFDGSATLTAPAMHWDATGTNVAMTQIGTTVTVATVGQIMMFGLVSPVAGAKTLKATWTGTGTGYMASMSFIGTVTSSVAACFTTPITATPTGATGSITLTSGASGNYSVAAVGNDDQAYTTVINATSSVNLFTDVNLNYGGAAYAPETGASIVYSWATSTSQQSVAAGCTVTAAASGTNANATGVAGTGQVGTVIASIGKSPTGVTGTGSPGLVTASIGANDTGVTGTGGIGTLAGSIGGDLTGVAGTGGAGTAVSWIGAGSLGVAGNGGVGTFTGQSGGTIGGVGGTGSAGLDGAKLSVLPSGVAGIGQVGNLSTPGTVNATVSGAAGTGSAGSLSDEIDAGGITGAGGAGQVGSPATESDAALGITGVSGTGQAGNLTTNSTGAAPPIQGGPGDDEGAGDEARRKWLEWSRKKRQKEKAKLATPQPIVAKAVPAEAPIPPGQSLLERNLAAQRLQIMQDVARQAIAAEIARQQEEDDEEAIALLLDA